LYFHRDTITIPREVTTIQKTKQKTIEDEQKILTALLEKANESVEKIAKQCNFSTHKVKGTIKKLEKNGTIWAYTAIIDDEAYNLKKYTMLVQRTNTPLDKTTITEILNERLDDLLPEKPIKIKNIEYVHGSYDWIVTFQAPDIITAKKYCERFNHKYHSYIKNINLLETIITIRSQSIRNPRLKEQVSFL